MLPRSPRAISAFSPLRAARISQSLVPSASSQFQASYNAVSQPLQVQAEHRPRSSARCFHTTPSGWKGIIPDSPETPPPNNVTGGSTHVADTPLLIAVAVLNMLQAQQFTEICNLFSPHLRLLATPVVLQSGWLAALNRHGPVAFTHTPVIKLAGGKTVVKIPVTCEHGELTVVISVDAARRLCGLWLTPGRTVDSMVLWEPPAYADTEKFDDQDVTVGSDPLAVGGTLSLPRQLGRHPAVVLLGGSGPTDRDSTIGQNKPLKDLAWGLASRGIAVLRFDKVTYTHPCKFTAVSGYTIVDEYVQHAVAAIHLLRQHPAIDAEHVFVLGHSLGGTIAPRVAASERSIAGLVILAGLTQPLHWAAVRQVRYIASLEPETAAIPQSVIEVMTRQATMVDNPELSPLTPANELPFGVPAPYWLDLRGYDPVATAAMLHKPMFILQGGRDFQVTLADDLRQWQTGLADCPNVTIRIYDADNHLFFSRTGSSTPAGYEPAQHVNPTVVADVVRWLYSHS